MPKMRIRGFRPFRWKDGSTTRTWLIVWGKNLHNLNRITIRYLDVNGDLVDPPGVVQSTTVDIAINGRTAIAKNFSVVEPDDVAELEVTVEHVDGAGTVVDSDTTTDDA